MPPELGRVRQRPPVEDTMRVRIKDQKSLAAVIFEDERWKGLPRFFQIQVLKTAGEVTSLTREGNILHRAQTLDEEIPQSTYLRYQAERYGTLMQLYTRPATVADDGDVIPLEDYKNRRMKEIQLLLTERLMGRGIEEFYTWIPGEGFVELPNESRDAICLCVDAVRKFPPPDI